MHTSSGRYENNIPVIIIIIIIIVCAAPGIATRTAGSVRLYRSPKLLRHAGDGYTRTERCETLDGGSVANRRAVRTEKPPE